MTRPKYSRSESWPFHISAMWPPVPLAASRGSCSSGRAHFTNSSTESCCSLCRLTYFCLLSIGSYSHNTKEGKNTHWGRILVKKTCPFQFKVVHWMKLLLRFLSNFCGLGKVNRVIFFGLRQRKLLNSLKIGSGFELGTSQFKNVDLYLNYSDKVPLKKL